jgi:hypothetical protein
MFTPMAVFAYVYSDTVMVVVNAPPEDDISVMAARTPTAIIAKVNANSFSTIDIFAGNALISKDRYWMFA